MWSLHKNCLVIDKNQHVQNCRYMQSYFKGNDDNTALGFDDQGDRTGLSYFIINIQHNTSSVNDQQLEQVAVGQYITDQVTISPFNAFVLSLIILFILFRRTTTKR